MELKNKYKLISIVLGTVLFNTIFWNEKLGLNLLFFHLFSVVMLYWSLEKPFNKTGKILIVVNTLLVLAVLFHNSFLSKFVYWNSLILLIGYSHNPDLKSIPMTYAQSVLNFVKFPLKIGTMFTKKDKESSKVSKYSRRVRLTIIPVAFAAIFIGIFRAANPVFFKFTNTVGNKIADFFFKYLFNFSWGHFFFLCLGLIVTTWLIYLKGKSKLETVESKLKDVLIRDRKQKSKFKVGDNNPVALTYEFKAGLILLVMVNIILLIVNAIDINWIWFGFENDNATHLSQFVHEGTYLLIYSILLSMIILLYLFRQNQNFYPKSNLLKTLSYVWIVQNCILIISVALRNYHYIHEFGLAYKRIGVIFFLTATLFGVVTMALKIRKTKSGFYLLKINSWMIYGLFAFASLINWDQTIVNHNISFSKPENIDVKFLMSLSDKTLPTMIEYTEQLKQMGWKNPRMNGYKQVIDFTYRVKNFKRRQSNYTWLSWNYADYKTMKYLEENYTEPEQ